MSVTVTDPRAVEAACEAYKATAGRVSKQAMDRALAAADEAVPQVPVEVADRLAEALEGAIYRSLCPDPQCEAVQCEAARNALADYRAAKGEAAA